MGIMLFTNNSGRNKRAALFGLVGTPRCGVPARVERAEQTVQGCRVRLGGSGSHESDAFPHISLLSQNGRQAFYMGNLAKRLFFEAFFGGKKLKKTVAICSGFP